MSSKVQPGLHQPLYSFLGWGGGEPWKQTNFSSSLALLRFVRRELFYEPGRAPKPDIYQINRKIADSGDRTRAAFETGALGRGRYQLRHARVVYVTNHYTKRPWIKCEPMIDQDKHNAELWKLHIPSLTTGAQVARDYIFLIRPIIREKKNVVL